MGLMNTLQVHVFPGRREAHQRLRLPGRRPRAAGRRRREGRAEPVVQEQRGGGRHGADLPLRAALGRGHLRRVQQGRQVRLTFFTFDFLNQVKFKFNSSFLESAKLESCSK